ncbi:uncharacterized protein BDW70DRAFT_126179 [Aspergillus foveolatus]|uniref:uncharacterized protein n=1 Tax=Aspergillus foveolatus TaxID=210207 RepID=UPI003CCCCC77
MRRTCPCVRFPFCLGMGMWSPGFGFHSHACMILERRRRVWDAVSRWGLGHSGAANLGYSLGYLIWPVWGYLGRSWLSFSVQPLFPPAFPGWQCWCDYGDSSLAIVDAPCRSGGCASLGGMYPGGHVMA